MNKKKQKKQLNKHGKKIKANSNIFTFPSKFPLFFRLLKFPQTWLKFNSRFFWHSPNINSNKKTTKRIQSTCCSGNLGENVLNAMRSVIPWEFRSVAFVSSAKERKMPQQRKSSTVLSHSSKCHWTSVLVQFNRIAAAAVQCSWNNSHELSTNKFRNDFYLSFKPCIVLSWIFWFW